MTTQRARRILSVSSATSRTSSSLESKEKNNVETHYIGMLFTLGKGD
jgi:hypothetical protein